MTTATIKNAMQVDYYIHTIIGIETPDVSILCDPSFIEGLNHGSFFLYPKVEDPMGYINKQYDYIYISHIHADHYDPDFLRVYLAKYPDTKLIIANFQNNYLAMAMRREGFEFIIADEHTVGNTVMRLIPCERNEFDIDSAFIVKWNGPDRAHIVANMNDNVYNEPQMTQILAFTNNQPVDIALVLFTAGGPYPQCYYDDPDILMEKARLTIDRCHKRYQQIQAPLQPKVTIPFGANYILGSKLHFLNRYRGVGDAVDVPSFDPTAVVLDDGGTTINTADFKPSRVRTARYELADIEAYALTLAALPLECETYFENLNIAQVPYKRLLFKAYEHFVAKSTVPMDYHICVPIPPYHPGGVESSEQEWFVGNVKQGIAGTPEAKARLLKTPELAGITPRFVMLDIDPRLLFGLLTGVFQWNNAECGSLFMVRRIPDEYCDQFHLAINFFHV